MITNCISRHFKDICKCYIMKEWSVEVGHILLVSLELFVCPIHVALRKCTLKEIKVLKTMVTPGYG